MVSDVVTRDLSHAKGLVARLHIPQHSRTILPPRHTLSPLALTDIHYDSPEVVIWSKIAHSTVAAATASDVNQGGSDLAQGLHQASSSKTDLPYLRVSIILLRSMIRVFIEADADTFSVKLALDMYPMDAATPAGSWLLPQDLAPEKFRTTDRSINRSLQGEGSG